MIALKKATAYFNDVMLLVSGTAASQIIIVLSYTFITRLFSPKDFGVLSVFTSIVGVIAVLLCLRYDAAIMLPAEDEDAANLLAGSLGIATIISILSIPLVWLLGPTIAGWLNEPTLASYLWLVPPVLFFGGMGTGHPALNAWALRKKRYATIASTRIADATVTAAGQLGAGISGFATAGSLIGATLLGATVSPLVLGVQIWRKYGNLFRESVTLQNIIDNLKRYYKFPVYGTWSTLLNQISWQIPSFMLAIFFSADIVGFYALGFRILQLPMSLVGSAIGQVFFQRSSEAHAQGKLALVVDEAFHRLVLLGLFPMLTLTLVGRTLAVVFFGEAWAEAGIYTQLLSIWAFFWFISTPMSSLYLVLEKQEFHLKITMFLFLSRLASLGFGGYLGSARLALLLFAGTGILIYGYLGAAILMQSRISFHRIGSIFLQAITYFFPFGILLATLIKSGQNGWIVVGATILSFLGYGLILWYRQPDVVRGLVRR
jgi:O-antigen/teichoic acid export membrane protein